MEYLAFSLGAEAYAVDILKVREIRAYERPTRIAGAPAYVRGVIDLRGTMVPIVDMRLRSGLPEARIDETTVVIILDLARRVVGMMVDGVSDVMSIGEQDLRPVPELTGVDASYLTGLAVHDGTMLIVMDVEALFAVAPAAVPAAQAA